MEPGPFQRRPRNSVRPLAFTARQFVADSESATVEAVDDWEQIYARIEGTPSDATIRGMFMNELLKHIPAKQAPRGRYIPFSCYPLREYQHMILQGAQHAYPRLAPNDAVVRLGLGIFPLFSSSLIGSTIFGIAQLDYRKLIELSPKAYEVTIRPSNVKVLETTSNSAVVQFRDVWTFPDMFHVGIWLGGMRACGLSGTITVTHYSACDADFKLQWNNFGEAQPAS